ncbi:MAG: RNA polymerase sigma-70 factor [Ignavibacteria bacterium]|jgi:RNA polymerase sigma-70 factor (ECF subfamily)
MYEQFDNIEQDIITAIRDDDESAFEILFRRYYPELCSYLNIYIRDKDEVEEMVQQLFLNIWERRKNFYPKNNVRSYLYKAVKNKAINYRKHLQIKERVIQKIRNMQMIRENNLEDEIDKTEMQLLIDKAVERLPARCRETFILVKYNNFSYQEAADIMNISTHTVEIQIGKALKKLRSSLGTLILSQK